MDPATFEAADPLVDKIADIVDSALLSDQLANPMVWILSVNGFMMDIRDAPREA